MHCDVIEGVVSNRYGDDYRGSYEGRGRRGYGSGGWNERSVGIVGRGEGLGVVGRL